MKLVQAILAAACVAGVAQAGCFGKNPRPSPLTFEEKVCAPL